MKKTLLLSSFFILSMGMNIAIHAQTMTPSSTAPVSASAMSDANSKQAKNRPCINIATACESAGYRLGKNLPGKNIWKDCVQPILAGQTISGVTADPADIQACKAHKAAWKGKHMKNMQGTTSQTPAASID